jgi:hypothetical protein
MNLYGDWNTLITKLYPIVPGLSRQQNIPLLLLVVAVPFKASPLQSTHNPLSVSETVRSAAVTDILEAHAGRSTTAPEFQGYPENYHLEPAQFDSRKQEEIAGRQMRREGPVRGSNPCF